AIAIAVAIAVSVAIAVEPPARPRRAFAAGALEVLADTPMQSAAPLGAEHVGDDLGQLAAEQTHEASVGLEVGVGEVAPLQGLQDALGVLVGAAAFDQQAPQ